MAGNHHYDAIPVQDTLEISQRDSRKDERSNSTSLLKGLTIVVICFISAVFMYTTLNPSPQITTVRSNIKLSELAEFQKQKLFSGFKTKYGKSYESDEENDQRYQYFKANLALADQRNQIEKENGGTAIHGITKFSDIPHDEFMKTHRGMKNVQYQSPKDADIVNEQPDKVESEKTSNAIHGLKDWRGIYTTPVKYQGACNSCWAFTVVEQVESDAIRQGVSGMTVNTPLSPQQLVSCYHGSCEAGSVYLGLEHIYDEEGLVTDATFPYISGDGSVPVCAVTDDHKVVGIEKWPASYSSTNMELMFSNGMYPYAKSFRNEWDMAEHVLNVGPIAVGIESEGWGTYTSGIIQCFEGSNPDSFNSYIDHSVQVVGVNIEQGTGTGYWIVRNTWGTDWGMDGYAYINFNKNSCGIGSQNIMGSNFITDAIQKNMIEGAQAAQSDAPTLQPIISPTLAPVSAANKTVKTQKPKNTKKPKKSKKPKRSRKPKKPKKKRVKKPKNKKPKTKRTKRPRPSGV